MVQPVWSWPLVLLASAVLLGVVIVTYPPRVRHLAPWRRRLLIGLRLATALLIVFALLRPAIRHSKTDPQTAVLIVLTDASRSMTTTDGPGGITRREALLRALAAADPQIQSLGAEVELRFLDFADDLSPVDRPESATGGRQTAIGKALDELGREESDKRLAGVVLMSDGAERSTGPDAVDPRAAARRFAEQRGVPIHTITFGSSELTGGGLDLAIEDVVVDSLAYERKTVPVRFQMRAVGAAGRRVRAKLQIERIQAGSSLEVKTEWVDLPLSADARPFADFEVRGNRSVDARELSFVAEQPGEYKLAVEAVPLDGETRLANNRYETVITVRKGGLKVAYFDVARPEVGKILRLNENSRIQLDLFRIPGGPFLRQARIDPSLFAPGAYDVYVIGDVPAFVFRQGGQDLLQEMFLRCRDGAGLAMLGGVFNFGAGGYADTPIAPLLPVEMSPTERLEIGQEPPASQSIPGPVQMLPGPDGRSHYLTQLGPNNEAIWRSLPMLTDGANRLTMKRDAGLLAWTATQQPLLVGWNTGRTRVLAFAVSDTWRWFTHGHEREHQRFWEQFLLWLAQMEDDQDQPVWAKITPRNFAPGEPVTITFGAQNEQKEPIADATYTVEVIDPDKKPVPLPPQRSGEENIAEFGGGTESGDYWVLVTATKDGVSLGPPARTRFIVDARDPELDNPAADPDLMAEIATITGTVPVPPESFGDFLDALRREGLAADVTRFTQTNLWDGWPLLLTYILLLTTEWFLRKRRGLV